MVDSLIRRLQSLVTGPHKNRRVTFAERERQAREQAVQLSRLSFREIEERLGITAEEPTVRRSGTPKSSYYRDEPRKDRARHRKLVDKILAEQPSDR